MKGMTLRKIVELTQGDFCLSLPGEDGSCLVLDQDLALCSGEKARSAYEACLDTEISSIVTDSRKAGKGSLFGAIAGTRVDGHAFIPSVFAQGAVCALMERKPSEDELAGAKETGARAFLKVDRTIAALGRIAEGYLDLLGIPTVGITGSVGKTSTKEMIAAVLSVKLRTKKTEGNFNNDLGLPLTVFNLEPEDEVAVLEMGVSHFGDMTTLARIVRPGRMVITNIGTCHLEYLKDREGVFRAKTEVFDLMPEGAQVFLNGNDDLLLRVQEVGGVKPVFFGVDSHLEGVRDLSAGPVTGYPEGLEDDRCVTVASIRTLGFEGSECTLRTPAGELNVKVPVPGIHNCSNAAAAAAVGLSFGMTLDEIREGIESARTISGRFRILKAGSRTVIDDCYNANPVSMKSSLRVLSEAEGRRCAVLGDMGELGENELALHEAVGAYAALCADHLVAIGPMSRSLYEAALNAGKGLSASWYESVDAFLAHADEEIGADDTVLVKASHYMQFGRIVEALT